MRFFALLFVSFFLLAPTALASDMGGMPTSERVWSMPSLKPATSLRHAVSYGLNASTVEDEVPATDVPAPGALERAEHFQQLSRACYILAAVALVPSVVLIIPAALASLFGAEGFIFALMIPGIVIAAVMIPIGIYLGGKAKKARLDVAVGPRPGLQLSGVF